MAGCKHVAASMLLVGCCSIVFAQESRIVTGENGIQYRETKQKILRPMVDTRYEDRERTVYREEVSTETRDTERVVLMPVTEYQWESYWVNRWNPFAQPYLAYRLVPRTRMEAHTEIVRYPLATRRLVPEKRTERVAINTRRMVEEEVTRRVAIAPSGAVPSAPVPTSHVAERVDIGGRKLASDPPREGSDLEWRPAGGTRGRY